jgi:hypothetical protein
VSQYVQQYFGYDYGFRWYCVLIMAAYVMFVRVTSILALKYFSFLKRWAEMCRRTRVQIDGRAPGRQSCVWAHHMASEAGLLPVLIDCSSGEGQKALCLWRASSQPKS